MMKGYKRFSWLFVLMLQVFLGIGVAFFALSLMKVDTVPENTYIGDFSVGGMTLEQARNALDTYFEDKVKASVLILEVDQSSYKIPYSDLDVSVDVDKTLESLKMATPSNSLSLFLKGSENELLVDPVIKVNSGKLLSQCESIFSAFEKEAEPEYYEIQGDVLRYVPQVPGIKVDYERLEEELKQAIAAFGTEPYRVNTENEGSILVSSPGPSLYEETFSVLISKSSVPIDSSQRSKAEETLQAIYGRVFKKGDEINLAQLIDLNGFSSDVEKDLLNRLATALYQSGLVIEGMEIISRKPANHVVSYSEPGLEAVIEGVGANLVLKNDTERSLMLLCQVTQQELSFYWVSTGEIRSGVLITQKKDEVPPPVITTINRELGKGKTRVASEGSPGYTVYVSRIIDDERVELYSDKYQPVSKMVETGDSPVLSSGK